MEQSDDMPSHLLERQDVKPKERLIVAHIAIYQAKFEVFIRIRDKLRSEEAVPERKSRPKFLS